MLVSLSNIAVRCQGRSAWHLGCRWKSETTKLTGEQKKKLLSILPQIKTTDKEITMEPKEFDVLTDEAVVQAEMDEIRARGFLKYRKPYNPPSNIETIVEESVKSIAKGDDWKKVELFDLKLKFQVLQDLASKLGFYVPNSDLHKLKTGQDVLEFYSTSKKNITKYTEMARNDSLPDNLKIREHPVRFHPNDYESHHGGITAFPGDGGEVISLRNKRLYRSFKPKKEWYDYEDQSFDYTPPDKGMPWDTEISQKADRYVDRKFKMNNLGK